MEGNGDAAAIGMAVAAMAPAPVLSQKEPVREESPDYFVSGERPYLREVNRHERGS
jgi:hypothetical protein